MEKLREELMWRMYDNIKIDKVVREIIYKVVDSKTDISERTDLISSHILDSISFIKLVSEIENVFDIEFKIEKSLLKGSTAIGL